MQEVCDFLDTSSGHAHKHTKTCKSSVSTINPNLESTQNQPSFLRPKFWAQVPKWPEMAILFPNKLFLPDAEGVASGLEATDHLILLLRPVTVTIFLCVSCLLSQILQ
jgi:hypothetical protein